MMKTSILAGMAAILLTPAICSAQNKAIVQTSYSSKDQAVSEISQILEKQGFRIDKTSSRKITAVFDPISNNIGQGRGERPEFDKGDTARQQRGQRPQGGMNQGGRGMGQGGRGMGQGGPGMGQGGPGMGQGGPGMGQGGPGMGPGGSRMGENSNSEMKVPTVTVRLKNTSRGVKATFVQKNVSVEEASENKMSRNELSRIVEEIPNNGISYK